MRREEEARSRGYGRYIGHSKGRYDRLKISMIRNEDGSQFVLLDQFLKSDVEIETRLARNLRGSSLLSVS